MSRWTHWPQPIRRNIFEALWEATKWKLNVLPSRKVTTATIVWLTGCGEGSFVGAQGFSRAIDAAREEMGLVTDGELGDMGVRVSIVKTGWSDVLTLFSLQLLTYHLSHSAFETTCH